MWMHEETANYVDPRGTVATDTRATGGGPRSLHGSGRDRRRTAGALRRNQPRPLLGCDRPSFWAARYAGGFTSRVLSPFEETRLLEFGVGLTNLVNRATAMAGELTPDELQRGARLLERKVGRFVPSFVAFLGLTSYRTAFARPKAVLGLQPERLAAATVWLLPNPSGINAHHQPADLARLFRALRNAVGN
jgi:double-stranded uracil-DNA glycosylase